MRSISCGWADVADARFFLLLQAAGHKGEEPEDQLAVHPGQGFQGSQALLHRGGNSTYNITVYRILV
jgi:hypothetical protein